MRRSRYLHALTLASAFAALALAATTARASSIGPGFDSFVTLPGAFADLTSFGLGIVPVEGVPIGLSPFGPSDADTIVRRVQGIDPFAPPGGTDTIDIEIVALQLRSVNPVDLTPLGGPFVGVFSDLWATINVFGAIPQIPQPDPLQPSIGLMQINHENLTGGTFTSCFGEVFDAVGTCNLLGTAGGGVFANGIAVVPGGDPNNPLDTLFSLALPRIAVSATSGTWVHAGGADDLRVTSIVHVGPHPVALAPEPATVVLLGLGLAFGSRRSRG